MSQPKAKFYDGLYAHWDVSPSAGLMPKRALILERNVVLLVHLDEMRGFFHWFVNNNLLIAYFCSFDITKPLPSYGTFDRFIRKQDNNVIQDIISKSSR